MEDFWSFIGKVVAYGGGSTAIAYGIFMLLGKKWIEEKFSQRLEAYKHAQEKELEYYRSQINILFSRVSKVHEKEMEVLPEIWSLLHKAIGFVNIITSGLRLSPPFANMTEPEFDEYLKKSDLNEIHKSEIKQLAGNERTVFYLSKHFWYELFDAKETVKEFHNYLILNQIFLSQDLKSEFQKMDKLFSSALLNREIAENNRNSGHGDPEIISKGFKGIDKESEKIIERIENLVQNRLEFTSASPLTIEK